jgi:UDP-N-acetylmuramyl tripeptide synthase
MGILTRRQDDEFVITSDQPRGTDPKTRAPARLNDVYEVWTGERWSTTKVDAIRFATLEAADEYVRANYAMIAGSQK